MSNFENHHDDDIPRFEPWIGVMGSAAIPVIISLFVAAQYLMPLFATSAVLFAASLWMLRRQSVQRRAQRGSMKGAES